MARHLPRTFDHLANDYARHDFLAREIDRRMQERLEFIRWEPRHILDLGCGSGGSLAGLHRRYPEAQILGLDRSAPMLRAGNGSSVVQADAMALPLATARIGLVWSNLLLHWLNDPQSVLLEARRVLEEGGLFMCSTLGPDTLKELRAAFPDRYAHTLDFADMHDLGDLLEACGFVDTVVDREDLILNYDSWTALLQELRQASPASPGTTRRRGLTTSTFWSRVVTDYPRCEGKWPVTFEVIYGHAWRAGAEPRDRGADGEVVRWYR